MHFDLIQSLSLGGDSAVPNDDRAGHANRLAWVIDGATDLGPPGLVGARGGAAWLAMEADLALAAAADAPLATIMASTADRLATRFAQAHTRAPESRWELPIAAMLAVRIDGDMLEAAWLGDCVGLLVSGGQITRFGAQEESKEAEGAAAERLAAHGAGSKQRSPEVLDSLRASRERPNRRILGVEPESAAPETTRLPLAPGDEMLLMTDGFAALVDVYAELDALTLVAAARGEGLAALASRLRGIEAGDSACTRYPRFKISDDATALWLRVGGRD